MADGIYVSMCGAVARSAQLDGIADNLANAQTPGFKAARPAFEDFLPKSGAPDKHYPAAVATALDLREGQLQETGNPLDVLPESGAFLAVRTPGGGMAYTRDGRLTLDAGRRLVSGGGNLVLSRRGVPIVVPDDLLPSIDQNGVVWAKGQADQTIEVGELARVRLDGAVDRVAPSLLVPGTGGKVVPVDVPVHTGRVELGNGGALEAAIQMVSAQRNFETSMQAIQTYRQLDARGSDLGRIR
jgi:flagellar basal-body rod protein FlgF